MNATDTSPTTEKPSLPDSPLLRVLIAHPTPDVVELIRKAVEDLGHSVVAACETASELVARGSRGEGDLIIASVDLPDFDGVTALVQISHVIAVPAIVVTQRRTLEIVERALKDHVMAYLVEPVRADDLKPSIYLVLRRFEQFQDLQQEVVELKAALEERKLIERAKGVLMRRGNINEEEAHKRLRRMATDQRIRMVDAARVVLSVDEVLES